MPVLRIFTDGAGMMSDVDPTTIVHSLEPVRVGALAGGMMSGKPSVALGVALPHNGGHVLAETSLALFLGAADALRSAHGDPRPDSLDNWIERAAPIAFRGVDCGTWHVTSADQLTQVVTCNDRCATWRDAMLLAFMRTGGQ